MIYLHLNSINVNRRNIGIKHLILTRIVDIWKLTNKNRKIRGCIIGVKHIYFLLFLARRFLVVDGGVSKDPFMFIVWSSYSH